MVTQLDLARKLGVDVSSVNKILLRKPGPVFRKGTIERVFRAARELGYDFSRHDVRRHRRIRERKAVRIPVALKLRLRSGDTVGEGTAVVCDLTPFGAKLGWIRLGSGSLPDRPFLVRVRFLRGPLRNEDLPAILVRLFFDRRELAMGVHFTRISASQRRKLRKATR